MLKQSIRILQRAYQECTPFQRKVYKAILKIPPGEVRSYAWVAKKIDRPKAARAVGQALKRNRWAPMIPCHRVIASDGNLGGYSAPGGLRRKLLLLTREGLEGHRVYPRRVPRF